MNDSPSVLVLTSGNCDPAVVTPVLAALEANGSKLCAFDVSALEESGVVGWMLRAISGDADYRRLQAKIVESRIDVAVCFSPAAGLVLNEIRKETARSFPTVAVVAELEPRTEWTACEIDRFLVLDDIAAVELEEHGVVGQAIVPVGGICEFAYYSAASESKKVLKERFSVSGTVVLARLEGMGADMSVQWASQLALVRSPITILFDVGRDAAAAAALRVQVPVLGMKAKLFGETNDESLYWRCADVILATPTMAAVSRGLALSTPMVCLSPKPGGESRRAEAVERRSWGAVASHALLLSAALDKALTVGKKRSRWTLCSKDGAHAIADAVWVVGTQRKQMVDEGSHTARSRRQETIDYAKWAGNVASPAGDLEDLGSGVGKGATSIPDAAKIHRMRNEIRVRKAQVSRTVEDARKQAATWDVERANAKKIKNSGMVKKAERNADMERARMHEALREMAELDAQERNLDQLAATVTAMPSSAGRATDSNRRSDTTSSRRGQSAFDRLSVDEELEEMRKKNVGSKKKTKKVRRRRTVSSAVDDDLSALKRKMARERKP